MLRAKVRPYGAVHHYTVHPMRNNNSSLSLIVRIIVVVVLFCPYLCSLSAQGGEVTDTIRCGEYRFSPKQLAVPAVLIGVGVWGTSGGWMHTVDKDLNKEFHFGGTTLTDDVMEFIPYASDILLGVAKAKTRYSLLDRTMTSATSLIIAEATVQVLKHFVVVTRPDGSDRNSFPSGHTARAFAGAELTRIHYGWGWGCGAYGVAVATAVLRLGHQRHWLSDVAAGAGLGILSSRAAMWLLPVERQLIQRLLRKDSRKMSSGVMAAVVPYASGSGGGVSFVGVF